MGKGVHWKWTTKRLYRWHISIWKAFAIASLGNCKLKHHEVPLHRDQNDWHRKRSCTHWWAGEQKGSRYSEYFINCTVFYVLQWAEDLWPDSSPYEGVCSRLIHRRSDTQPNETHISRWAAGHNMVLQSGCRLWLITGENREEPETHSGSGARQTEKASQSKIPTRLSRTGKTTGTLLMYVYICIYTSIYIWTLLMYIYI